jgi:HD superfamily phosphohydrolase YqeK
MCDVASTESPGAERLPPWSVLGTERRAHAARVVALLEEWAAALGLDPAETDRWRAVGWLHDALRDADPETLRPELPPGLRDLPGPLCHGPAAAARLRAGGCDDEELLDAVAWHTLGCARFGTLGRALYLADFLDPGRTFLDEWRAALRARMPAELDDVLVEVAASRLRHLIASGCRIRPETHAFWNAIARGC